MSSLQPVTDQTFQANVLQASGPVLVDFWAPWCGPCRQVTPIIEQIAVEYADKLTVFAMNTDENPTVPQSYQISSIPTLNVYLNGELVKLIVAAHPKPALIAQLSDYLN